MWPPSSRHTGSEAGPRCWSLTMTPKLMPTVLQVLYLPTPARVRVLHWLPVPCAGPLPLASFLADCSLKQCNTACPQTSQLSARAAPLSWLTEA